MSQPALDNEVRRHRERVGLSQQELADLVGVSRQAIVGIEGGKQVPATSLALRLASALRCGVEDLFRLRHTDGLAVRLSPTGEARRSRARRGGRVAIGEVEATWVAHGLPALGTAAADGILRDDGTGGAAVVQPLSDPGFLRRNVLVAGCAPILGLLAQRVGARFVDARATWLPDTSERALQLLEDRLVHVAGVHLSGTGAGEDHGALIRDRFPGERMLIVNLTRWREGLVVSSGNPLGIVDGEGLARSGLRFARREEGAGAHRLVQRLLNDAGAEGVSLSGPLADGHVEVAQLVRSGAADVGMAIEGVALAAGLGFVPIAEERFDLVVPASVAAHPPVARLLEALDDRSFRADVGHIPGYDTELSGHVTTLEAA